MLNLLVCVFRKPSGASGKGLYELKQEFYSEYSPFYYHYTRTEQAKVICSRFCLILLIILSHVLYCVLILFILLTSFWKIEHLSLFVGSFHVNIDVLSCWYCSWSFFKSFIYPMEDCILPIFLYGSECWAVT